MRVVLIDTVAPDRPNGSMLRYGQMVQDALASVSDPSVAVRRLQLAPRQATLDKWPAKLQTPLRYLWIMWQAVWQLPRQRGVILHLLDGSHAYLLALCPRLQSPLVITVHDLIPLLTVRGELGGKRPGRLGAAWIAFAARHLRRAEVILADSQNTVNDVIRMIGVELGRTRVVHPPLQGAILHVKNYAESVPYILHVAGNNTFYKNRLGVVEIFKLVREQESVRLKMVGAPPNQDLLAKVKAVGLEEDVDFVSNVTDAELVGYYRSAAVFLFPSLYEGFGWPPLEAMQQGCPVVCTNAGSLPEIVGDAGLLVSPDDVGTLADHCVRLLRDAEVREQMVAKGYKQAAQFNVQAFAAGLLQTYSHVSET